METVLSSHIQEVDKNTAGVVILLASSEMTRTKVRASGMETGEDSSSSSAAIP